MFEGRKTTSEIQQNHLPEKEAEALNALMVELTSKTVSQQQTISTLKDEKSKLEDEKSKLEEEKSKLEEEKSKLEDEKSKLEDENKRLTDRLLYFLRQEHGHSSERFIKSDPNQLRLEFEGLEILPQEQEAAQEASKTITYQRKADKQEKAHPVRLPLPENLERVDKVIEPENIPEGSVLIGQEITEILEREPERFYVLRIIRNKYALPREGGIIIAQMPSLPIAKSNAGASVLSRLLVGKYQDHLPFYRQIEMFKRVGVKLAPSTINGWFTATADLLTPLYDVLKKQILSSDYLQVDESTIPVMDADRPGATRKGYHWIVRAPEMRKLYFHYDQGSRAQRVAVDILKDFRGAVQSDGYVAYNFYEDKKGVILLGCWAHARRKFEEALKDDYSRASYALEQIQLLYHLERQMENEKLTAVQISQQRQRLAYPILVVFEKWLYKSFPEVLPHSKIGKAIAYTYSIFNRLSRYVMDGRYRIDNNLAENGVRSLALGRKNYLFCGNHQAAKRTAIIYSLLGTCKINKVNPEEWLADVLNRIQDFPANKLSQLLPQEWEEVRNNQK